MMHWTLHPQLATDTHVLTRWPLCDVLLMDDANHPWLILVPRVAEASELIDLDPAKRMQLTHEIDAASRAMRDLFQPDKLNVAALGNMVPQLHVHVIARFRTDIAWPRPAWGAAPARPYAPAELTDRMDLLREALTSAAA